MYRITFMQINYFLTIAKVLNFTEASNRLFISQPALSKQIRVMETELGFPLFKRNKRSVELTEEGQLLYRDWTIIENMMNSTIDNAKRLRLQAIGNLNIGYTDTFQIDESLTKLISIFQTNHPNIDINFGSYGFKTLRTAFEANELDLVFIPFFELTNYKNVEFIHIQTVDLSIAVPLSNPLSEKNVVTVDDLKNEIFVMITPKESSIGVDKILLNCRNNGYEPKEIKYVNNLNSLTISLENGVGVTICQDQITDKNVKFYKLPVQPRDSDIMAVWKTKTNCIELDLFKTTLLQTLNKENEEEI